MTESKKPVRVLLTGFGPWALCPDGRNPSWLLASSLDGVYLERHPVAKLAKEGERPVSISTFTRPIGCEYDDVLKTIPQIHDLPYESYIHLGQIGGGHLQLETLARNSPYLQPDFKLKYAPKPFDSPEAAGWAAPPILYTRTDVNGIVKRLNEAGIKHLVESSDAGLYNCEFTFFNSLFQALKNSPRRSPPLVDFIHIPGFEKNIGSAPTEEAPIPYTFKELQKIVLAIVWEIAQGA